MRIACKHFNSKERVPIIVLHARAHADQTCRPLQRLKPIDGGLAGSYRAE